MPITELEYTFNADKGRLKKQLSHEGNRFETKRNILYGVEHKKKNGYFIHMGPYNN
jgi:hypothetical protein